MQSHTREAIYFIAALATAGVILRPFSVAEAVWAVAGAAVLLALGLISISDALTGIGRGGDVYLFLFGMMLLAEVAREERLFDWLAAVATSHARGSPRRLFFLIYCVGTVVTIFLSNDATAVGAHTSGGSGGEDRQGERAAALSFDLHLHRQRGLVRAADLQPG